jgi:hypothetical protein
MKGRRRWSTARSRRSAAEGSPVFNLFRVILRLPFLETMMRPVTRVLVGVIAIPVFRLFLRKGLRVQDIDKELEKDLEQWFRGALLLLVASANMEDALFGWVPLELKGDDAWVGVGLRLLLAIGVIEAMPDQDLFGLIHSHPPNINWRRPIAELREKWLSLIRALACKHLNRTSPVFVIMTAIFAGAVGWTCYWFAIVQYLIIGLVTSRDKAVDFLSEFDKQVAARREEIVREFDIERSVEQRAQAGAQHAIDARDAVSGNGIEPRVVQAEPSPPQSND